MIRSHTALARAASTMAIAVALTTLCLATAASGDEALRATMRGVLDRLTAILPLALGDSELTESERAEFEQRLAELRDAASRIESHGRERDPGFRFLARSLGDDLRGVEYNWKRHNEDSARYFLVGAMDNCVACHARLPRGIAPVLASSLEEQVASETASASEKAHLLVATRQFERALQVWEAILADPEMTPTEIDIGGYLLDYLTIAVRVARDLERPVPHLRALAARPATPRYLRNYLTKWIAQLELLSRRDEPAHRLHAARALNEDREVGLGTERLVADLQVSAWLLQALESDELSATEQAEAFYLLGVVESRNVEGYWIPQTDAHLEAAVRLDPGGPFAGRAYDLLEEWLITGYGGIQGNTLPVELHARLGSLIEKMEDARVEALVPE